MRARKSLALLVCAVAFAHPAAAESEPVVQATVDEADAARLRALGYIDISPTVASTGESGVSQLDPLRAAPGHSLIVDSTDCSARLLDRKGNELRLWQQQDCRKWWGAALMRNGDLFVNGSLPEPPADKTDAGLATKTARPRPKQSSRFTARIAATGETAWIRVMRSHHQLDVTPAGELLVLTEATLAEPAATQVRKRLGRTAAKAPSPVHDNLLEWISPDGETLETFSLYDTIAQRDSDFPFADLDKLLEGPRHIGLFHCNSAFAMNQPGLADAGPLYLPHNVLLTSRNQNRIFIVNRRTRSLVWAWGRDELQAPHHATWLANGHVLVFDNGIDREHSRVVEVDPHSREIVWQYPTESGVSFFTRTRGSAQRLENGNTLIVESSQGRAFEVTPQGDLVWEYLAPVAAGREKRPVIITLRRYPESWLEAAADSGAGALDPSR